MKCHRISSIYINMISNRDELIEKMRSHYERMKDLLTGEEDWKESVGDDGSTEYLLLIDVLDPKWPRSKAEVGLYSYYVVRNELKGADIALNGSYRYDQDEMKRVKWRLV